jgi:hypothetical protein
VIGLGIVGVIILRFLPAKAVYFRAPGTVMAEPTIVCPRCNNEIKLTESLAAPLIESTRREFEQLLAQKDTDVSKRENTLQKREAELARAQESLDDQVADKVREERTKIIAEEARKAKIMGAFELQQKVKELTDV